MQVYVLEQLNYEQSYVVGVYSTLELAVASASSHSGHAASDPFDNGSDEWIVDCGPEQYSVNNHDVDA